MFLTLGIPCLCTSVPSAGYLAWQGVALPDYGLAWTGCHLGAYKILLEDWLCRELYAFFLLSALHCSVIYDPKAKDNEEKSAELFEEFAADALQEVVAVIFKSD